VPRNPGVPNPPQPGNPNPPAVVPRDPGPAAYVVDVYICKRCGKRYEVPAGSPPPAQCTCGNSGPVTYSGAGSASDTTSGTTSHQSSGSREAPAGARLVLGVLLGGFVGLMVLLGVGIGGFFLIKLIIDTATRGSGRKRRPLGPVDYA
jgi:hypothetical protein